jgi:hypothetical protein
MPEQLAPADPGVPSFVEANVFDVANDLDELDLLRRRTDPSDSDRERFRELEERVEAWKLRRDEREEQIFSFAASMSAEQVNALEQRVKANIETGNEGVVWAALVHLWKKTEPPLTAPEQVWDDYYQRPISEALFRALPAPPADLPLSSSDREPRTRPRERRARARSPGGSGDDDPHESDDLNVTSLEVFSLELDAWTGAA